MTMTDQHLWEWLPDLHYYPTRPSTYGTDPHQPSNGQYRDSKGQLGEWRPSEFHMQAALKGGWTPAPKKRQRRRKKR